ncbi:MAG: NAD(P)H-binding protein [Bacteroidetes bacterium]|nr:NAD(P)H-binding protein [Bacteroidota bacterium]
MKIVLTGSLGNVSRPLASELIANGHQVKIISRNPDRQEEIEALGAEAAIGEMEDLQFLISSFREADCVYLMEAVGNDAMFNVNFDIINAYSRIAENYRQAVLESGIKKVVHLSSVGAHTTEGNGVLSMHFYAEQILNKLPGDVTITFMRPVGFFSNLFRSMKSIKEQGVIISNYGGNQKEPWVSALDIAAAIVKEMESEFAGRKIRYVASEEVSPDQIAETIGMAIGQTDLKWLVIPDEALLQGMISMGMNRQIAQGFVDMQAAQGSGELYQDYYLNKPELGNTKLTDFAKEFARRYNS